MEEKRNAGQENQGESKQIKEANENPETLMERQNPQKGRDIASIDRQEGNMQHGTTGVDFSNRNERKEDRTGTTGNSF